MDEESVSKNISDSLPGVEVTENFGYKFFFYADERILPFATLANADYEYDRISNLDRPGIFRLNIGVSRQTFVSLFGPGDVDLGKYDFRALDVIMPHPEYSKQHWICVLSPSRSTFETVRSLLAEAHGIARRRHERRVKTE